MNEKSLFVLLGMIIYIRNRRGVLGSMVKLKGIWRFVSLYLRIIYIGNYLNILVSGRCEHQIFEGTRIDNLYVFGNHIVRVFTQ